jgi:mRNA-degrading endonuclease RelE of RelBE toxin-antitoxin system
MLLLKTKHYIKSSNALSKKDRVLLLAQEKLLSEDIFHSKLHTKKLKGFLGDNKVYSFRITRMYRGIFRLLDENIILFAIGHRKDIYQPF